MQTSADSEVRVVEVFADITCPFTHVGLRRLVRHRESVGRNDVVLRVRAWPLELVNDEPPPKLAGQRRDRVSGTHRSVA